MQVFLILKGLSMRRNCVLRSKPANMFGSFIVGVVFAVGWTPCVGPALASILGLAGVQKTLARGVMLLTVYSLGLGIPFILTSLALNIFWNIFDKVKKYFKIIAIISGLLLIVVGILIIIGWPKVF